MWADLILSMLAVSSYPLERVIPLEAGLRDEGVLEPLNLCSWSATETAGHLRAAGYDRGKLTALYADRLISLGTLVARGDADLLKVALESGSDDELEGALLSVHGVGPAVVRSFLALRKSRAKTND